MDGLRNFVVDMGYHIQQVLANAAYFPASCHPEVSAIKLGDQFGGSVRDCRYRNRTVLSRYPYAYTQGKPLYTEARFR